jgi:hypothetical protein
MKAHQCIKSGVFKVSVGIKINPNKSMEISFTRCRMNDPLNYSFGDRKIPEASCFKYLGIIIRNDFGWADHVNYTVQKTWRALHFAMRILRNGKQKYEKFILQVTGTYHSRKWGGVLGYIQGMSVKCFRPCTK